MAGKIAIVTGAAHGLGAAISRRFVLEGAQVVLADTSERGLEAIQDELGDTAASIRCDVSAEQDVAAAIDRAEAAFGGLDVLVNNAAVGSGSPLTELRMPEWERVLAVNLGGVLHGIRYAAPALRRRGGGAIVNLSSIAARRAMPGLGAYSAAKAGVEAVTRCAAVELRADGIRVNAIAPGLIGTEVARRNEDALLASLRPDYLTRAQGRWGTPDEVAAVAVHLAGDEATFTTGTTYVLDNGATRLA
ncbi:SDR family NAD(P)-dependent oxidoreductase [Pseudonocardia parietis]|uniref:3alpha(Or 20beta)-hydroxysteroid dehydrogenase n=1 Tax=Pseudonocardia parietis TaxID=570936 RepID=A0ABS4VM08_9PSEU|nr:SDR family oxidoreductase [Pseudonocardia parietis]MBP2364811.1 3alpha(or 20beta)-hydroxysteroid dehydrogenase [Pseudonocardia parietis]